MQYSMFNLGRMRASVLFAARPWWKRPAASKRPQKVEHGIPGRSNFLPPDPTGQRATAWVHASTCQPQNQGLDMPRFWVQSWKNLLAGVERLGRCAILLRGRRREWKNRQPLSRNWNRGGDATHDQFCSTWIQCSGAWIGPAWFLGPSIKNEWSWGT